MVVSPSVNSLVTTRPCLLVLLASQVYVTENSTQDDQGTDEKQHTTDRTKDDSLEKRALYPVWGGGGGGGGGGGVGGV